MAFLEKMDMKNGFLKLGGLATGMIGLSVAILLLSASMRVLSGLN